MLCNFVDTVHHLGETCCLNLRVEEQSCTLEIEAAGPPKCRHLSTWLNIASHNAVIFIINFTPQFQNTWSENKVQYLWLTILNSPGAIEKFLTLHVCNTASPTWSRKLQQLSALHCKSKYKSFQGSQYITIRSVVLMTCVHKQDITYQHGCWPALFWGMQHWQLI